MSEKVFFNERIKMRIVTLCITLCALLFIACFDDNDFDAMGMFEADELIISAESNGKIIEFKANLGYEVKKGESLAKIDSTPLELNFQKISLQVQNAKREEARLKRLYLANAGTKKSYDDAVLNAQILQKELELLEDSIAKTNISAPISGVVLEKYTNIGEFASIAKPICKIADTSILRLKVYLINSDVTQVALNDKVRVFSDYAGGLKEFEGVISWISPKAEFTPKTIMSKDERENLVYAVKIDVPNPQGLLKIGSYGQIKLK